MPRADRRVAYRPEREEKDSTKGSSLEYRQFLQRYILPHRWLLLVAILLVTMNTSSVYLMSYYGQVVVDKILVIRVAGHAGTDAENTPVITQHRDRRRKSANMDRVKSLSERLRPSIFRERPPGAMGKLIALFAIYITTLVTLNFSARFAERLRIRLSQRITAALREDMHEKILSLSRSFHQSHSPGALMSRILSDVRVVQVQMLRTLVDCSSYIIMFLIGTTILFVLNWKIAVFVLAAMIPYTLAIQVIRVKIKLVNEEIRHTNSCLWGFVSQKLDSVKAIFAYGRERSERLNLHRLSSWYLRDSLSHQRMSAGMTRSAQIISSVTTTVVFLYCARLVMNETITLGRMMYIYGATANLFTPVMGLAQMSLIVTSLLVVMKRLIHIFDEPLNIEESPSAVHFPNRLNSGIELRNVTFQYSPDIDPVLQDINLTIPAGEWVCIMGPSGSGKSTLLHLLTRLYDTTSGSILVDGIPLPGIRFDSLRRHLAMVPQEAQIFSGTIRDNITYGHPDAQATEIMAAAKAAECHDFVMELPVKYETTLGEKGATLSGGQRQRLSMARALLTNPEVLLLDDCTSALDADTERRIQETLARLMAGKTAIVVSQRVSMAIRCHHICILEQGRITELGTHEELVRNGGFYSRLFAQQTE